jgi:hypothetical protein
MDRPQPGRPPLDEPPGPSSDELARREGLTASAIAALGDLRRALHERARLLTQEVRLAGLTLVQLIFHAVIVAVLVVSAWIGLMGGLVATLVSHGVHWGVGLGVGIVLNLALAGWLVRSMMSLVERMDLQASLRRLEGAKDESGKPQE